MVRTPQKETAYALRILLGKRKTNTEIQSRTSDDKQGGFSPLRTSLYTIPTSR